MPTKEIPDSVVDALGMPKHEITLVTDHKDGTLAQTKDGNVYIVRDDGKVQLYVPAHPTVRLPIETYKPSAPAADLGVPVATPVAPEVALALEWRQRQLEEAAERDGVKTDLAAPAVVTEPLADASAQALVSDAGPQLRSEPSNENPADQKPDTPSEPQPAAKVVKRARAARKRQA